MMTMNGTNVTGLAVPGRRRRSRPVMALLVVGGWLVVSPLVLSTSRVTTGLVSAVTGGLVLAVLAGWAMAARNPVPPLAIACFFGLWLLRDHLLRQLELADAADAPAERDARRTFVVVGAGYTGTEVAAHGQLLTRQAARQHPRLRGQRLRWLLVDLAPPVLPELDRRLSAAAHRTLTGWGVEIRSGTSVTEATSDGVRLSDGQFVPTRSLIWCVGVRPDPLVDQLGLPTSRGRRRVDEYLAVPGHPRCFACGDLAAVPDLTRPGQLTLMTAQLAVRQGRLAARDLAGSLGHGRRRRTYRHHDLGFVVDLAGAKAVTRGYHLAAIPAKRARIAGDWLLDAVLPRQAGQFGLVRAAAVPLGVDSLNPRSGPPPPTGQPHLAAPSLPAGPPQPRGAAAMRQLHGRQRPTGRMRWPVGPSWRDQPSVTAATALLTSRLRRASSTHVPHRGTPHLTQEEP
jgi:hypothetical protein